MIEKVLGIINNLRQKPKDFIPTIKTAAKALKRVKRTQAASELDKFAVDLETIEAVNPLILSQNLCQLCDEELEIMIKENRDSTIKPQKQLVEDASKIVKGFTKLYMAFDYGGFDFLISRMIVSEYDPQRNNKKNFMSDEYSYIGISHVNLPDDEEACVLMFADHVDEIEHSEFHFENFVSLKKAFDSFDVRKTGFLDPKELKTSFKILNYDVEHPAIYQVFEDLDIPANNHHGINFRTFSLAFDNAFSDTESKEGTQKLFNAFIDDPNQKNLNSNSLIKLCKSINIPMDESEAQKIIHDCSSSGVDLTFDEFHAIMLDFYTNQEEEKNKNESK